MAKRQGTGSGGEAAAGGDDKQPGATGEKWQGEGNLREYYLYGKYPQSEIDAVAATVGKLFRDREKKQQRQMVAEILSFHQVVYHTTGNHDLRNNHRAIRQHQDLLKTLCERHQVPFWPVLAITSWENSGGTNKVSWADAAGLGQMTPGAVDEAHRYATRKAKRISDEAKWQRYHGEVLKDEEKLARAVKLEEMLSHLNVEERHKQMAKKAGVKDERAIVECNLEDVVLFFDFLLSRYGGRIDHGIAAYHKGVLNQDDILYDYMRRRDPRVLYPQKNDRSSFLEALEAQNVTYLDLWNDPRSREMLNGLRTVEGEVTTRRNAHMALGDESDIYPWKVLASLSALRAGEDYLEQAINRYTLPQLAGEVRGLPEFRGEEGRSLGANKGYLAELPQQLWTGEQTDRRQSWVRPELVGYLSHLRERVGRLLEPSWRLPVIALGRAEAKGKDWEHSIHAKGVAVKLNLKGLTIEGKKVLNKQLTQDYLFDRIYLRSTKESQHLVLNPRFGMEFIKLYKTYRGSARA